MCQMNYFHYILLDGDVVQSRIFLIYYVITTSHSQSLKGKPSRPHRQLWPPTCPKQQPHPKHLSFVSDAPTKTEDNTKSYQRYFVTAEMTSSGPAATPLPLESWALLHVRIFETYCATSYFLLFTYKIVSPQCHMSNSRSTFTQTTASGNLLDLYTRCEV